MDGDERAHHQESTASPRATGEATAGDPGLAQRLWGRYGGSPGVIPMATTLGLSRRITRPSMGRLPLLTEVQRRWAPADVPPASDRSSLPYAPPAGLGGTPSGSSQVAQFAPDTPRRLFEAARPVRPAAGQGHSRRTSSTLRAGGAPSTQPSVAKAQRTAKTQTEESFAAGPVDPGPTIVQRRLDSPAGQAVQRQVASPQPVRSGVRGTSDSLQRARPPATPGDGAPLPQPVAGEARDTAVGRTGTPVATSTGDLGAAILRRHLAGPSRRAVQRVMASPGPARPAHRPTAGVRSRPETPSPLGRYWTPGATMASDAAEQVNRPGALVQLRGRGGSHSGGVLSAGTSANAKTSLPLAVSPARDNTSMIARQVTTATGDVGDTGSPRSTEPVSPVAASAPEAGGGIDMDSLVERVSRDIYRRLAVERERRGIGRWH